MFQIEVDGEEYEYAFLNADGVLNWDDREYLIRETIGLYRSGRRKRILKGEEFEGMLTKGKFVVVARVSGQNYDALLDTEKGKREASILVAKVFEPSLN